MSVTMSPSTATLMRVSEKSAVTGRSTPSRRTTRSVRLRSSTIAVASARGRPTSVAGSIVTGSTRGSVTIGDGSMLPGSSDACGVEPPGTLSGTMVSTAGSVAGTSTTIRNSSVTAGTVWVRSSVSVNVYAGSNQTDPSASQAHQKLA